jgi:peptidoglycan/LPS O-acetylase OafA/YrhL
MERLALNTGDGFYLELQRQLPGQIAFFMVGAAAYYYLDYLIENSKWLVAIALVSFIFQSRLPWVAIQPVALGILVVYFACIIPFLGNFDKYGDFSYGIYIVHFPILQLIISFGLFKQYPWTVLCMACILILFAAFLLWHFIEKPFLRKSSHYFASNHG